ncbi:MAG: PEP-CTERM sorting domain-containing protein [Planctomycetota bacterium]|jgi:hypothetical protein
MMKKLLVLLLVLGLSGVASAVPSALQLIAPAPGAPGSSTAPLGVGQPLRVYIETDSSGLGGLAVTISLTGNGQITGGTMAAEAGDFGVQVTDWGPGPGIFTNGGWQSGLSFNAVVTAGTQVELGLGQFQSTVWGPTTLPPEVFPFMPGDLGGGGATALTPIAYLDVECFGPGDLTLTMVDGSRYGTNTKMDDGTIVTDFGSAITIYQIPEPMTIALLGLGSLVLLRRRRK